MILVLAKTLGRKKSHVSCSLFSPLVNYIYHKMLLNENESYLVVVTKRILLVTINNVY